MTSISEYKNNGYIIIKNVISINLINQFNSDIKKIYSKSIKTKTSFNKKKDDEFSVSFKKQKNRKIYYALLQDLRSVKIISNLIDEKLCELEIYKKLNFRSPSIKNALIISLPNEEKFDNPLHQDIYAHHSKLYMKIWAPLTEVNEIRGSMEVFKKSHKKGFIIPKYDKLDYYPEININHTKSYDSELFRLKPGHIVLFNPLILHRSIPNQSNYSRFVLGCDIQDISKIPNFEKDPNYKKMLLVAKQRTEKRKKINY